MVKTKMFLLADFVKILEDEISLSNNTEVSLGVYFENTENDFQIQIQGKKRGKATLFDLDINTNGVVVTGFDTHEINNLTVQARSAILSFDGYSDEGLLRTIAQNLVKNFLSAMHASMDEEDRDLEEQRFNKALKLLQDVKVFNPNFELDINNSKNEIAAEFKQNNESFYFGAFLYDGALRWYSNDKDVPGEDDCFCDKMYSLTHICVNKNMSHFEAIGQIILFVENYFKKIKSKNLQTELVLENNISILENVAKQQEDVFDFFKSKDLYFLVINFKKQEMSEYVKLKIDFLNFSDGAKAKIDLIAISKDIPDDLKNYWSFVLDAIKLMEQKMNNGTFCEKDLYFLQTLIKSTMMA